MNQYLHVCKDWTLNEKQIDAAKNLMSPTGGALAIYGLSGAGKTWTLSAIMHGFVAAGRSMYREKSQVIACAPSDAAVDKMVSTLTRGVNLDKAGIRICVFRGCSVQTPQSQLRASCHLARHSAEARSRGNEFSKDVAFADCVSSLSLDDIIWDGLERTGAAEGVEYGGEKFRYTFSQQKRLWIQGLAGRKSHQWHEEGAHYRLTKLQSRAPVGAVIDGKPLTAEKKTKVRQELPAQEDLWTKRFLQEEVDIVFCTNSCAAHETLMEHYKPQVLICDEASLAPLPDCATPMAAFKDSLRHVVIAGDHSKQCPQPLSRGRNETISELETSLLHSLIEDSRFEPKVLLDGQHLGSKRKADDISGDDDEARTKQQTADNDCIGQ